MSRATIATVFFATLAPLLPLVNLAAAPYEVKEIRLGGNLLEAYLTLKSRYGDTVAVKQWRQLDTDTISLIANRSYCGSRRKIICETMTVSSLLPLYRERVVRIELEQSFIRKRREEQVVASLVQKYGDPFSVRKNKQQRLSSTVMVWSANSKVPATMIENASSWVDYRILAASFVVTEFGVDAHGLVSGLTIVSENHELQARNSNALLERTDHFKEMLISEELHF